jgi:hypothetical protein
MVVAGQLYFTSKDTQLVQRSYMASVKYVYLYLYVSAINTETVMTLH